MLRPVLDQNFDEKIRKSKKPVLVQFWAEWCGPCRMIMPAVQEIAAEFRRTLAVNIMNVDQNPIVPQKLGIRGIPTLMIFSSGQLAATKVGALPKSKIIHWIRETVPPHEFDDALAAESNFIGVIELDGKIRVVELNADGRYKFVRGFPSVHGGFVPRLIESPSFLRVIKEFEVLINDAHAKEQDYQDFFEAHPKFILGESHARAHAKIVIESEKQGALIPDFVLEPFDKKGLCDLLEIKRPDAEIYTLKKNRGRFSHAVREAVIQLRYYSDCFQDKAIQERVHEKYGLNIFKPKMIVIIGRRGDIDPQAYRMFESEFPDAMVRTYDDVLDLAKRRFGEL